MMKRKIFALFIIIALALAVMPTCAPRTNPVPDGLTPPNIVSADTAGTVAVSANNLFGDRLDQIEIYKRFLTDLNEKEKEKEKETSNVSENLKNAIENAEKLPYAKSVSDSDINNAVNQFNEAAENFRAYYFDPENKDKLSDAALINQFYIGGVKCAYDEKSKTFYYTMGQIPNRELKFDFYIKSGLKSLVFAEIYGYDGTKTDYQFIPELNKEYKLRSFSKTVKYEYKIIFTMLPLVQIDGINKIGDEYRDCTISVTDPDFEFSPYAVSTLYYEDTAQIHIRGSSARWHPKKSYAIKFVDENKQSKNAGFFGINKDSHWLLDAMYNDMARMRNRVSTDLWLAFSGPLYYEHLTPKPVYNGTQGGFVEVFVNNEYMGLFCLTTKVNRSQLQLKKYDPENKTIRGISYKGKGWDSPLRFKSYYDYNNHDGWWASFQQKYPNPRNGLPIDWKPLYDLVRFVVDSDDDTFKKEIGKMIDIDNFVDYTIFLCFSYAHDNTGKNAYWSIYDLQDPDLSKFFITVWDVKSTWGRSWHPGPTSPTKEWMDSDPEHDTALFRRLVLTNADHFADKVRARWEEVKVGAFSPEAVKGQFIKYFDLFEKSGAFEREAKKWDNVLNGHSSGKSALKSEREYILKWIDDRYAYIDDFIKNQLDAVGKFKPRR